MANIADLVVSLSADIASFRDGMAQSKKAVNDLSSEFASAKAAASSFIETIGELVAAREVVSFLQASADATRGWAEELAKFQGLAGLSSKEAATFAASAQIAGVNTDIATTAMSRLGTVIATHPQKFQQLGIAIHDASGQLLPMTEIMRNTIAGLDEFKAGTDRAAAAGFLFGRGAEAWLTELDKLGPQLKAGNWAENAELVKTLGLSMSDAKAQAEEWAKAQGTLKLELLGVENQIGQALLPVTQELGAEILKLAQDGSFKRWGEEVGAIAKALATDIGLAAKAVDILASAISASAAADVAVYNRLVDGQRKSILKPWTPSPNGGFIPPDQRNAMSGTNAATPGGDTDATPDGTKTFNVPDPKTQALNDSIAALTANLQRDTQQNQQLAAAMGQSGDAAKKLQDQFTALNKIDAIRAQALRDGIKLSDSQVASLTKLALAEGQSAEVLQRATELHNNLADAMKKQDEELQKLVQSSSLLSPKEADIADKEGLLWAAFNQGTISAQQFNDAIKQLQTQLNGPDKGMEEFTQGLSGDFSTLIGKATDFNAIMTEAGKKGGQSVFKQLEADAADFLKSLEQLVVKLTIVNPLLNSLGLGGQGGKQLPTIGVLGGSSGATSPPPVAITGASAAAAASTTSTALPAFDAGITSTTTLVQSFAASIAAAIAAIKAMIASSSASSSGSSLSSIPVIGGMGGAAGGGAGAGESVGGMGEGEGFARGGDFTVAGNGGTDTKRVSFLATPGERVSVMSEVSSRGRSGAGTNSGPRNGDVHINMPISGMHSDTFRANRHQITGDMLRAISAGRRYA